MNLAQPACPPVPLGQRAARWILPALAAGTLALLAGPAPTPAGAAPAGPLDPGEPPVGELWVQNMASIDPLTAVAARFTAGGQSYDFSPILLEPPPRSADVLRVGSVAAALPDGQLGAALGPTTPFASAAVARNEWPATGAVVAYRAGEADTRVVVPWVVRRHGDVLATSRVRIQNARTDRAVDVAIRVTAMGAGAPAASLSRTIPAGGATELDLANDADLAALPDGFAGAMSAQAGAGGQIAAVATTELAATAQSAYAVAASRASVLGDRLVAPRVAHQRAEARGDGSGAVLDSFVVVMNAGAAPAAVTVTYRGADVPGNACAGQTIVHGGGSHAIPAGSAAVFAQGPAPADLAVGTSGLPAGCLATADIRAGGASLAATVVEIENGARRAGAYEALPAATAQRAAYLPLFRRGHDDLSSSVTVANAGDQTTLAQAKFVVVAEDRTITVERSASLAPGAAASWDARDLAEVPAGAIGAAVVTGARVGVPLVAVARETSDDGKRDNALYASLVEPDKIDRPAPMPDIYQPFFAPSVWHSGVYDLGLMATGTTPAEIQRITTALNAQAFAFARRTGLTIAVSVQPYMQGKVPFHDWLETQIDTGFRDVDVRARTWLVGLNYNAVTLLGRSGRIAPIDANVFPGQGDFLDEAWNLNFVTGDGRPSAVPWLREGCSPNYRNLALVAASMNHDHGFRLMRHLARVEQQRENYRPGAGRTQIGFPTLKALYTEFGIQCPAAPEVLRTRPERVDQVVGVAVADADRLASAFASREVDTFGDAANAAKAVGVESDTRLVVAQPMLNPLTPEELDRRLRSPAGLVVGSLSLQLLPTPLPTDTPTATHTPTATDTASATATATPSATPTATSTNAATATASATAVATTAASATPTPSRTAAATTAATATPSRTAAVTATPSRTVAATATASATPTATTATPPPILLPFLSNGFAFAAPAAAPAHAPPADGVRQGAGGEGAYAVVWRLGPDGTIQTEIVPEGGGTVDPGDIGITVPPVVPGFPGGVEPEAWVQRGSVIVCTSVGQYKGCLTVDG